MPLVGEDPDRIVLIFANPGVSDTLVYVTRTGVANRGILTSLGGGVITFTIRDHPGLVQSAWFGNGTGPTAALTIFEVILEDRDCGGADYARRQAETDAIAQALESLQKLQANNG